MKNGRFSDAQIMGILKQAEGGVPAMPGTRDEQRKLLQMAIEVWRYGCINDVDAALRQNNVLGFKLTVDLSQ
jgi:hypothetical protein